MKNLCKWLKNKVKPITIDSIRKASMSDMSNEEYYELIQIYWRRTHV